MISFQKLSLSCYYLIDCHKGFHEVLQLEQSIATAYTTYLIVFLYLIRFDTRIVDEERNWFLHVSADLHWSRVVWQYRDADWFYPCAHLINDRFDQALVEVLNGLEF